MTTFDRSTEVNDDILEEDRHIILGKTLNVSNTTVENHLKCLGLDIWISHELKEIQKEQIF